MRLCSGLRGVGGLTKGRPYANGLDVQAVQFRLHARVLPVRQQTAEQGRRRSSFENYSCLGGQQGLGSSAATAAHSQGPRAVARASHSASKLPLLAPQRSEKAFQAAQACPWFAPAAHPSLGTGRLSAAFAPLAAFQGAPPVHGQARKELEPASAMARYFQRWWLVVLVGSMALHRPAAKAPEARQGGPYAGGHEAVPRLQPDQDQRWAAQPGPVLGCVRPGGWSRTGLCQGATKASECGAKIGRQIAEARPGPHDQNGAMERVPGRFERQVLGAAQPLPEGHQRAGQGAPGDGGEQTEHPPPDPGGGRHRWQTSGVCYAGSCAAVGRRAGGLGGFHHEQPGLQGPHFGGRGHQEGPPRGPAPGGVHVRDFDKHGPDISASHARTACRSIFQWSGAAPQRRHATAMPYTPKGSAALGGAHLSSTEESGVATVLSAQYTSTSPRAVSDPYIFSPAQVGTGSAANAPAALGKKSPARVNRARTPIKEGARPHAVAHAPPDRARLADLLHAKRQAAYSELAAHPSSVAPSVQGPSLSKPQVFNIVDDDQDPPPSTGSQELQAME